ncbi:MAG: ABC transporter permease subunit [Betaproteobacteria bacterium]|nr:ABC transporter permease subunit [Betaproteobacteria bacterium]
MGTAEAAERLKVGSKRFTESYILAEIVVRAAGGESVAMHKPGLGNTGILHAALSSGSIDVYPEYTGTIAREILKRESDLSIAELNAALAAQGLAVSQPLGFNNTYAVGVRKDVAAKLGLRSIGDLAGHPSLRFGFSHEFLARNDGWRGLARSYGLEAIQPAGLDHGIAYEALDSGRVDVIDVYSTDAKVLRYGVQILADDRNYFPRYDAVLLYRRDVPQRFAAQWQGIAALAGHIDEATMLRMNAAAEIDGLSFRDASALLFDSAPQARERRTFFELLFGPDFARLTVEHLLLVFIPVVASILVGVPLGIAAVRRQRLAQPIFALAGIMQTIPSLALLAFLVALIGAIGIVPAAIALFLYGLLPIVRNTHTGLVGVGNGLRQAAAALGLSARDRLLRIELPLAAPAILAGIKTAAVINVGTATIAAFVGAGGYGERIASGLALNDSALLLAGAIPAAALALLTQAALELAERYASPWQRAQKTARPKIE